jgi:hypothetical protein
VEQSVEPCMSLATFSVSWSVLTVPQQGFLGAEGVELCNSLATCSVPLSIIIVPQ